MSNTSEPEIETVFGYNGEVVVERKLTRLDEGIVGVVEIRSTADEPVRVHITDEFPVGLPVELVAFRPSAKPDDGDITAEGVRIAQTVDVEPVTIEYGIKLTDSAAEVTFDHPVVRDVQPATVDPVPYPDGGERSSANGDQPETDTDESRSPSSTILRFDETANDGEPAADGQEESQMATDDDTPGEASSDAIAAALDGVEEGDVPKQAEQDDGPDQAGTAAGDFTRGAAATAPSGTSPQVDPGGDREPSFEDAGDDGGGDTGTADADVPRSLELRVDRLSARVEEFGTYATALEELLDTHGTGSEIIDRLEDDIDTLDDRVQSIRDDLERRSSQYAANLTEIERQADALEEQVDATESSLMSHVDSVEAELSDELARVETQFDERITTVEDDVQRVRETMLEMQAEFAAVSDAVEELQAEFDDLQSDISEFSELQQSLTEVFGAAANGDIQDQL